MAARHPVLEVLAASLRLGLTSFGGPIAHIGYFRREYVERRRWLDETHFADLLALSQALPGPASSQLGIAIGTLHAGRLGGVVSWIGFTLPSAMALVVFALVTRSTDLADAAWIHGLKLAAVAVVVQAVVAMWRALAPDATRSALVVLAAAIALALPTPATHVVLIAAGALIGGLVLRPPATPREPRESRRAGDRRHALAFLGLFVALLLGLPLVREAAGTQAVALAETFYRAGSLVFGGGHVILPLLDASVDTPGWIDEDRFLAGYGAAQAVPGPLFSFSAFLGASVAPEPNGATGALIAVVAIFLPSFLLVWGTLPFWDALRARPDVRRALAGINAAVVGILLAALVSPVATGSIVTPIDAVLAAVGIVLLMAVRAPPILVVVVTAIGAEVVSRLG